MERPNQNKERFCTNSSLVVVGSNSHSQRFLHGGTAASGYIVGIYEYCDEHVLSSLSNKRNIAQAEHNVAIVAGLGCIARFASCRRGHEGFDETRHVHHYFISLRVSHPADVKMDTIIADEAMTVLMKLVTYATSSFHHIVGLNHRIVGLTLPRMESTVSCKGLCPDLLIVTMLLESHVHSRECSWGFHRRWSCRRRHCFAKSRGLCGRTSRCLCRCFHRGSTLPWARNRIQSLRLRRDHRDNLRLVLGGAKMQAISYLPTCRLD